MSFSALLDTVKEPNFNRIFTIINDRLKNVQYAADGTPVTSISHTSSELAEIRHLLFNAQKEQYIRDGAHFSTLAEAEKEVHNALNNCVIDGFSNAVNGIGTSIDPSMYNMANSTVLMSPEECTSMYANGGIAEVIINKKSKGSLLNGFELMSNSFSATELKELRDYAESLGFSALLANAIRDSCIYGGSAIFPVLNGDNALTMAMTFPQLYVNKMIGKGCLSYFVSPDRWNLVAIPNYDICAADYLKPRTFYVPISGLEVHTDRLAQIVAKPQPYWSAIRNLGWGTSDFTSYARALLGYEIMSLSLPIMCQQMSLLVHQIPLDGLIAQNGVEAARKWQQENEKELRDWSILNPKAINNFGSLEVVNRNYSGFDNLIDAIRKDVSAKSGLPESVLFYTQPNGIFNKTEEDVLLKQSETIRLIQRTIAPSLNKILPFIACSFWGINSWEDIERYKTLQISFDTPIITSPSKKADIAVKYAQTIKTLVDSGMMVDNALAFATKVIGEVELPTDFESVLTSVPDVNVNTIEKVPPSDEGETNVIQEGATNGVA